LEGDDRVCPLQLPLEPCILGFELLHARIDRSRRGPSFPGPHTDKRALIRWRRQFVSNEEYKPSRRNNAPTSPAFWHASACLTIRRRYTAENRRRRAFAGTSGSGSLGARSTIDLTAC